MFKCYCLWIHFVHHLFHFLFFLLSIVPFYMAKLYKNYYYAIPITMFGLESGWMVDYRFVWLSIFSSGQIPTPGSAVGCSLRCKVSLRFTHFKLPLRGIFENYSINELLTLLLPAYLIVFRRFTEYFQRAVFQPSTPIRRLFSPIVTNKMLRNGKHQPMAMVEDRWQKKCSREGTMSMR